MQPFTNEAAVDVVVLILKLYYGRNGSILHHFLHQRFASLSYLID